MGGGRENNTEINTAMTTLYSHSLRRRGQGEGRGVDRERKKGKEGKEKGNRKGKEERRALVDETNFKLTTSNN
jgi:hypothetical protein